MRQQRSRFGVKNWRVIRIMLFDGFIRWLCFGSNLSFSAEMGMDGMAKSVYYLALAGYATKDADKLAMRELKQPCKPIIFPLSHKTWGFRFPLKELRLEILKTCARPPGA